MQLGGGQPRQRHVHPARLHLFVASGLRDEEQRERRGKGGGLHRLCLCCALGLPLISRSLGKGTVDVSLMPHQDDLVSECLPAVTAAGQLASTDQLCC